MLININKCTKKGTKIGEFYYQHLVPTYTNVSTCTCEVPKDVIVSKMSQLSGHEEVLTNGHFGHKYLKHVSRCNAATCMPI